MSTQPESLSSTVAGPERRRHRRYQTDVPAEALVEGVTERPMKARVVECSRSGLRAELAFKVATGAVIRIQIKDVVITGEVRHCGPSNGLFHAGIEVVSVCGPDRYEHLADLELDLYAMVAQMVQLHREACTCSC